MGLWLRFFQHHTRLSRRGPGLGSIGFRFRGLGVSGLGKVRGLWLGKTS